MDPSAAEFDGNVVPIARSRKGRADGGSAPRAIVASHRFRSRVPALALVVTLGFAGACAKSSETERARSERAATEHAAPRDSARTSPHLIEASALAKLRTAGLDDPVARLVADLRAHPELIPFPGELGGTMGFHDSTAIHVLNDHWVYATFDDGHVQGRGLFEYTIADSARIRWQTVGAYLE
jgi:hypothetical protein